MELLWKVDWAALFEPRHSLLELVLRGTLMYWVVLVLLRLDLRRQIGGIAMPDILVVVLIAEIAGSGIAAGYESIGEGAVLVATVLFWSFALEWLQFRFPAVERLLRDRKLKLVEHGRMMRRNMRIELVTPEELMSALREQGVEDCAEVSAAYLEANGKISVILKN